MTTTTVVFGGESLGVVRIHVEPSPHGHLYLAGYFIIMICFAAWWLRELWRCYRP